jgi:hypothetical protein
MARAPSSSAAMSSPVRFWLPPVDPRVPKPIGLSHLQAVVATHPEATRWHVVCDQLNTHQSESLVRFVAELSELEEDLGVKGECGILASMVSRAALSPRSQS